MSCGIKIAKKCFPLFMKKVKFGIKIVNNCFPLFMKNEFWIKHNKISRISQKCKLFRKYHLGVRSVNFFENIISGVRSVNMCKLSFLRLHAKFQFFSVNHVFECLIDGFRRWEGRNQHRMDLL